MSTASANPTQNPSLYEINSRVWLREIQAEIRAEHGEEVHLGTLPDRFLDELAEFGFDLVWMMGVWETGVIGEELARSDTALTDAYRKALPDFVREDVVSSPYAVRRYRVREDLGGSEGMARFRERLRERGMGLVLDFVPNHTALDHGWVRESPQLYVQGNSAEHPGKEDGFEVEGRFLAHGRDPNFPPWKDTAQLDLRRVDTREALISSLAEVADQCEGVRCDMAMLVLDSIFRKTWRRWPAEEGAAQGLAAQGLAAQGEFWARAIPSIRARFPGFIFIAEAYWGLESFLQNLGFDYTYDKTLYDRLVGGDIPGTLAHLNAELEYQRRAVRFLENHDEERIAKVLPPQRLKASMVVTATVPGLRMFHEGQLDGRKRFQPIRLQRRMPEPRDADLHDFYTRLLGVLREPALRLGIFRKLTVRSCGDNTHQQIYAARWDGGRHGRFLMVVNLGGIEARGLCSLEMVGIVGGPVRFRDRLGSHDFEMSGDEATRKGIILNLPSHAARIFELERIVHGSPGGSPIEKAPI